MYFILQNLEKMLRTAFKSSAMKITLLSYLAKGKQAQTKTIYKIKLAGTVPSALPYAALDKFNIPKDTALDIVQYQQTPTIHTAPDAIKKVLNACTNAQLTRGQEIAKFITGEHTLKENEAIYFVLAEHPNTLYGIYAFIYSCSLDTVK